MNRELTAVALQAGLTKRVTSHTFCHSIATHLIEPGDDIRTVQEMVGHEDVAMAIYPHVIQNKGRG